MGPLILIRHGYLCRKARKTKTIIFGCFLIHKPKMFSVQNVSDNCCGHFFIHREIKENVYLGSIRCKKLFQRSFSLNCSGKDPISLICLVESVGCHEAEYSLSRKKTKVFTKPKNESIHLAEIYLAYLLYGSVASLSSPSSNIEAWPYGTSLRFGSLLPAFRALGVCEHSRLAEIENFIFQKSLNGLRSGPPASVNQIAEKVTVLRIFRLGEYFRFFSA